MKRFIFPLIMLLTAVLFISCKPFSRKTNSIPDAAQTEDSVIMSQTAIDSPEPVTSEPVTPAPVTPEPEFRARLACNSSKYWRIEVDGYEDYAEQYIDVDSNNPASVTFDYDWCNQPNNFTFTLIDKNTILIETSLKFDCCADRRDGDEYGSFENGYLIKKGQTLYFSDSTRIPLI